MQSDLTTKDLEIAILQYHKNYELKSLRASLPWECDILVISKDKYASEFELKRTRADFKADFKKPKHKKFEKGQGGFIRRFWFVVPQGMVATHEVPDYAGLMYVYKDGDCRWVDIIKYPQTLESKKVQSKNIRKLYRSMMYRFLQLNFKDFEPNLML